MSKEENKETAVAEFKPTLPAIPEVLNINGVEVSEKLVQKEVDALKKLSIKDVNDRKTYDLITEKKKQIAKLRTQSATWREKTINPVILKFQKDLKAKIDGIGSICSEGEQYADSQLYIIDEWEREQARLAEEKKKAEAQQRQKTLLSMEAVYDPTTTLFTFPYDEGLSFNAEQLLEMEKEEWEDEVVQVVKSFNAYRDRKKAEEEKKKAEEAATKEMADKLMEKQLKLRRKEIDLLGAVYEEPYFVVNGHYVDPTELRDLDDEEWEALVAQLESPNTIEGEPEPMQDERFAESDTNASETEKDPLEAVISGMVEKQNVVTSGQHKTKGVSLDIGEYEVSIKFDKKNPYLYFPLTKKTAIRLFVPETEELSTSDLTPDDVAGTGKAGDARMMFVLVKLK